MFKSNLYFLKNINIGLFLKVNIFLKKKKNFYKSQINSVISIFFKKNFTKNKFLKTENAFFKKNYFYSLYFYIYDIAIFIFLIEIIFQNI